MFVKALELLKTDFPALPPAALHLHKVVPIGAGLGGGSADAAFALRGLNEVFSLGLSEDELLPTPVASAPTAPFFC